MLPGSSEHKETQDMEETVRPSPPLELRRPASGPRTTIPHSLQSPQERTTGKFLNFYRSFIVIDVTLHHVIFLFIFYD